MPPKAKFSKDEIIEMAIDIVRAQGMNALTARALGLKLNSSARPIFTVFQSMEEVQQAVIEKAKILYGEYVKQGLHKILAFKGVGEAYIQFAMQEPKLFQILFMTEQEEVLNISCILPILDDNYETIRLSIQNEYAFDEIQAKKLYQHLWIYTHGIAVLCATKMCRFTGEEISEMISEVCQSLLRKMKAGEIHD